MQNRHTPLYRAARRPLALAVVAALAAVASTGASAQDAEDDDAARLDRIEVTGSRIKRADVEGALPVTVIDRQQIDISGDVSVADYLRNTTFNSFGSFRPQSGSSAQSFAEISLRGLGGARTLVLIDGRRVPTAPNVGQAQDLNSIPLAAVERIEILSDGASAIYGSDAIGGVINIITRKDFNGVEATLGMSDPTHSGGETEEGSVIFGVASDRGNLMAGVSYNTRGILFARERPWSSGGLSTYSNNFMIANPAAGTLYGFTPGGFLAHPDNGSAVPGPGGCSNPNFLTSGSGADTRCLYNYSAVSADEAEVRNQALFTRANYRINDDWTTYLGASVTRIKSFGRYAPVPSSPWPGGQPFIPVGSPNHPAVRFPDAGYDPTQPVFLRHRFAALGNRDNFTEQNVYNFLWGVEGRIGDVYLDAGVRQSESKYLELGRNYVVGAIAQQYIADGTYDIYDPAANPRSVLDSMIATINRESTTKMQELYANASLDLFEMPAGTAGLAIGAEYRSDEYADIYDTLQSSGQIVGSSGNTAGGGRDVWAVYGELLLPLLDNLELSLAARYDAYSDYGNDTSPKISIRYQPLDTLTLRASYGEGFRAPTLDLLTAQASFAAESINDPQTCAALGLPSTCTSQVDGYRISNRNLGSEHSEQWTAGLAWDATDWLNLTVDYYNIRILDRISFIGVQTIQQCLLGIGTCPSGVGTLPGNVTPPHPELGLGLARGSNGAILYVQEGFANRGSLVTDGVDFNLRTQFDLGGWGAIANQLQWSRVLGYAFDGGDNAVDDPSTPKDRIALSTQWTYGDFSLAWNINYIASTLSFQGSLIASCDGDPDCIAENDYGYHQRLPSWVTHDLQASWATPWDGKLTVGVKNIADKDPVLDPFQPTGRAFDFNLYDQYGRVPYVRYTQTF